MKNRNNSGKYGDTRVRYNTPGERKRAAAQEAHGFVIPAEPEEPAAPDKGGTHLLNINTRRRHPHDNPPAFIRVRTGSSGARPCTVQEPEGTAGLKPGTEPRFPVFHVPHDGGAFPEELMDSVCVPGKVFARYHEEMRDRNVTRLIPRVYRGGHMTCSFPVSRLLCDVERFIGPEEIMERYGMGFCYEKAYDGTVIRSAAEEVRRLARRYYDEHHRRMDRLCEHHHRMLLFDMHSYWDDIVPGDFLVPGREMPDLCIGTDGKYTPPRLAETVERRFAEAGLRIAVNYPYSGFFIPDCVMNGSADCDLAGIMLEFHRRAYLDENGEDDPEKIKRIRAVIRRIAADCVNL